MKLDFDDRRLRRNLRNADSDFRRNLRAVVDRRAAITQGWLKQNARWTDRTGAARSGLTAIPIHTRSREEIFMAYSVDYGIWLEIANDRQYAIITPAMRIMGDALMKDMRGLLNKMGRG